LRDGCWRDIASRLLSQGFELDDAIKQTLKKALYTNTLYRGLREACRILDARQGLFCILAKSCDHGDYVKLVEALCAEHGTHLLRVADGKQLGEWSGLCSYDKEGQAHKVVGASVVVVHQNVAKENDPAVNWLIQYAKTGGDKKA
jgi:small subunit ribosomal protein S12e